MMMMMMVTESSRVIAQQLSEINSQHLSGLDSSTLVKAITTVASLLH